MGILLKVKKINPLAYKIILAVLFYYVSSLTKIYKECSINFNYPHLLRTTAQDNFINNYIEEKRVYQDELKSQLNKFHVKIYLWSIQGTDLQY